MFVCDKIIILEYSKISRGITKKYEGRLIVLSFCVILNKKFWEEKSPTLLSL
jgi:hypothetical protein